MNSSDIAPFIPPPKGSGLSGALFGKKELTDLIQRNFAEEIEEVRAETRAEVLAEEQKKRNNERREMARNLAEKAKWSYEKIAEYMNTTLDEIKALLTPRK